MGRQVHIPDVAADVPGFELVATHSGAQYFYRFLGSDGHRVQVFKNLQLTKDFRKPDYTVLHPGVCGCRGYQYRETCKHAEVCREVWAAWPTCVSLYARHDHKPVMVDVAAVSRALREAHPVPPPSVYGEPL